MPRLKGILCQVEWNGGSHTPLNEYKITYSDGLVQCYIPVPLSPTCFVIHLKSSGYIAPGLAIFVYIDGEYQCNRNRTNLKIPAEGVNEEDSEVDFRVRQKEYSGQDGIFMGKQWQFRKVTEDPGPDADQYAAKVGDHGGSIEVVVLRCYNSHLSQSRAVSPSSSRSGMSSARSSYMDEQDVPMITRAMLDDVGDSPPRHHTTGTDTEPRAVTVRFMDGASSPPSRGRSQQRESRDSPGILSGYRHGSGPIETETSRGLTHQYHQPITMGQPMHQHVHGGVNAEPSWSNTTDLPPATDPNDMNWNESGVNQTETQWDSTSAAGGYNQQSAEWDKPQDDNGNHDRSWDNGNTPGNDQRNWDNTASSNAQQQQWNKPIDEDGQKSWNTENGQSNIMEQGWPPSPKAASKTGTTPRDYQPQNMQDIVFGPPSQPAPSKTLESSNNAASQPHSGTPIRSTLQGPPRISSPANFINSPALSQGPLPGIWNPYLGTIGSKSRDESIKRKAAELNASREKFFEAQRNAHFWNEGESHAKPLIPWSARNQVLEQNASVPTHPETEVHPASPSRASAIAEENLATTEPPQDDAQSRELRSPSPAEYVHKTSKPHYMDTIADPYARFIFRYREDTLLSDMCEMDIVEPNEVLHDRLACLTKQEIIKILIAEREEVGKEQDEKDTTKSSLNSAGYQPNLNVANQKLSQWDNTKSGDGDNGWDNANNKKEGGSGRGSGNSSNSGQRINNSGGRNNQGNEGHEGGNISGGGNTNGGGHGNSSNWNDNGGTTGQEDSGGNGANNQADADWDNGPNTSAEQPSWQDNDNQDQDNGNKSGNEGNADSGAIEEMQW